MSTIKDIIEKSKQYGYLITKEGVDKYSIVETYGIQDFTKPLRIHREIPKLAKTECYNGVPIGLFASYDYAYQCYDYKPWCYLANKQDGDYIYFNELLSEYDNEEQIALAFDFLRWYGFIKENDNYLDFYFYPIKEDFGRLLTNQKHPRLTPLKYLK